jgi:hypothetical protein
MSKDEKISRLIEILDDPGLSNAAKFDLMEEVLIGDRDE